MLEPPSVASPVMKRSIGRTSKPPSRVTISVCSFEDFIDLVPLEDNTVHFIVPVDEGRIPALSAILFKSLCDIVTLLANPLLPALTTYIGLEKSPSTLSNATL